MGVSLAREGVEVERGIKILERRVEREFGVSGGTEVC